MTGAETTDTDRAMQDTKHCTTSNVLRAARQHYLQGSRHRLGGWDLASSGGFAGLTLGPLEAARSGSDGVLRVPVDPCRGSRMGVDPVRCDLFICLIACFCCCASIWLLWS